MRRLWLGCFVLAALAACRSGGEKAGGKPAGSAAAAPSDTASAAPLATKERPKAAAREGSSIARAPTDDALYIADEDHGVVRRVPLPLDVNKPAPAIPMPGQPAQVLALADRVLVTIRSTGAVPPAAGADKPDPDPPPEAPSASADKPLPKTKSAKAPPAGSAAAKRFTGRATLVPSATGPGLLLILKPDPDKGLVEEARVELPQDAWGLAITPDESTALVTSAWSHKVSSVDIVSHKLRWTVDVPREPRAVVVRHDGRGAYITHLVGADLTRIDDLTGEPKVRAISLPASPLRTPVGKRLGASLAYSATLSPDGRRLYVARHALGAIGPQAWFGAATVDVLLTANDTPLAPMRREGPRAIVPNAAPMFEDLPAGGDAPRVNPMPFAQPRAVAYQKKKDAILVLGEGSDSMVALDARAIDPSMHSLGSDELIQKRDSPIPVPSVCGAPSGLAFSADEATAWIYCRSTNDILVWTFDSSGPRPTLHLADDLLSADAALGRRIYYNGTDSLTSGGLGCAGCHPEGREDGHVWHETIAVASSHETFVSGPELVASKNPTDVGFPRQTPMLAGRVAVEGPYGWHAESGVLTQRLISGFSLHRWNEPERSYERKELWDRAMALRAYLRKGLVPPPHEERELTEKEKRGRDVFASEKTGCVACHAPATEYTDREPYPVFSKLPPPPGFAADPETKYKTPSLRFVAGTPPYLHDGRFGTLAALIAGNDDRMGKTNHLSADEKDALIAFLETL